MRSVPIIILLVLCASPALAQLSEIGVTGGVSYYIGDINPKKHYPKNTHFTGGLVYKYNFKNRYTLKLMGIYGQLEAYDADSDDEMQRIRNLHFRTTLTEVSGTVEVNFFPYRHGKNKRFYTPYLFAGLAYFRTNPKAELNGQWIDLQPLGTEGQGFSEDNVGGEPYALDQLSIPFGGGFKVNIGRIDLAIEWGLRRTYTDHIDDVSGFYVDNTVLAQTNGPLTVELADRRLTRDTEFNNAGTSRGDPETRDWYQYTGFMMTYLIAPKFPECDQIIRGLGHR